MDDLWSEIDDVVLQCLAAGVAAPAEIGQRLGMSEAAAGSILAMLAAEGKVTICRARLRASGPAALPASQTRPRIQGNPRVAPVDDLTFARW